MGQGAEDAGGYEIEYDPYYEGLATGTWTQSNGNQINASRMSESHLRGAIRVCKRAKVTATFSCDEETWDQWIELFEHELTHKEFTAATAPKKPARGAKQKMQCHCGTVYKARTADLKRNWAKSCSKRCASIRREYGRPAAKKVD